MRRGVKLVVGAAVLLALALWGLRRIDETPKGRGRLPDLPTIGALGRDEDGGGAQRLLREGDPDEATLLCQVRGLTDARLEAIPFQADGEGSEVLTATVSGGQVALRVPPGSWWVQWSVPIRVDEDGVQAQAVPIGHVDLEPGEVRTCSFADGGYPVEGIVVDTQGSAVAGAFVVGCGFAGPSAEDGTFSAVIPGFYGRGDGACELRARWMDGLLSRSSDPVVLSAFDVPPSIRLVVDTAPVAGLGIGIFPTLEGIRVTTVHPGSPAERAGLEPGDVVVEVDGVSTAGMELEDFVRIGTGREGTVAKVDVLTEDGERLAFSIRRERLAAPPEE